MQSWLALLDTSVGVIALQDKLRKFQKLPQMLRDDVLQNRTQQALVVVYRNISESQMGLHGRAKMDTEFDKQIVAPLQSLIGGRILALRELMTNLWDGMC